MSISPLTNYKKKLISEGAMDFVAEYGGTNHFLKTLEECKKEINLLPSYIKAHARILKKVRLQTIKRHGKLIDLSNSWGSVFLPAMTKEAIRREKRGNPHYRLYVEIK